MSIVLVIIGLIVGGVVSGRYLIRTAELRSIITDEQRYISAVNTFRTKYNELPGDMVDATNLWGTDANGCPDDNPATPIQTATCNGNGNGLIESDGTGETGLANQFENFRAWQQLGIAGLIPGNYTGVPGPYSWDSNLPGINVPATKLANGGFEWMVFNANAKFSASFWGKSGAQYNTQYLLLGSVIASAPGPGATQGYFDLVNAILTPSDAQAIDLKMDDGIAGTGSVIAPIGDGYCTTPQWSNSAVYYIASNSIGCTLLFQVHSW